MEETHDDLDLEMQKRLREAEEARKKVRQDRIRKELRDELEAARQENADSAQRKESLGAPEGPAPGPINAPDALSGDNPPRGSTSLDNPEEEDTSIIGDIGMGIVGGVRDELVNASQLGLDILTLGQTNVDLDSLLPDIEDRDSTTFDLVKGSTQFLTAFVPVIGVMGKLAKAKRIANAVKNGMELKRATDLAKLGRKAPGVLKETWKGILAREYIAGGIADGAAFGPHEQRLSDLIEDKELTDDYIGFDPSNPITEYLASDGDDSKFEGRLKNVLEGGALGVLFDAIFRGAKGAYKAQKGYRASIRANGDIQATNMAHSVTSNAGVKRQQLEELDAVITESHTQQRVAREGEVNPAFAEARAGGDALSPEAQELVEAAELRGQTLDEYLAPMEQAAKDESGFGKMQIEDPKKAARFIELGDRATQSLLKEREVLVKEVIAAEKDLHNLRNSKVYNKLPAAARAEWEKLDEFIAPQNLEEIKGIQEGIAEAPHVEIERASGRDQLDALRAAGDAASTKQGTALIDRASVGLGEAGTNAQVAAKNADNLAKADALANREFDIYDVQADGTKEVSVAKLSSAMEELYPKDPGPVVMGSTTFNPHAVEAMTHSLKEAAKRDPKTLDAWVPGQIRGVNNYNTTHIGGQAWDKLQNDQMMEMIRDAYGPGFKRMTNDEKRLFAIGEGEKLAQSMGSAEDGAAVLERFITETQESATDIGIRIHVLRQANESALYVLRTSYDSMANGTLGQGAPAMFKMLNAYLTVIRTGEALAGVTGEVGGALSLYRSMAEALPSFVTELKAEDFGDSILKQMSQAIDAAGGTEKIMAMFKDNRAAFESIEQFSGLARNIGAEAGITEMALEAWMGVGLLSGISTHATNITANTSMGLWVELGEELIPGLVRLAVHGEKQGLRNWVSRAKGALTNSKQLLVFSDDPSNMIGKALKARSIAAPNAGELSEAALKEFPDMNPLQKTLLLGESASAGGQSKFSITQGGRQALTAANAQPKLQKLVGMVGAETDLLKPGTSSARLADVVGNIANTSFKVLQIEDEVAKVFAKGGAAGQHIDEYVHTAMGLKGDAAAIEIDNFAKQMDNRFALYADGAIDKKRFMVLNDMNWKIIEEAREYSWTQSLTKDSISGDTYKFLGDHPVFKIFQPFMKVMVNLTRVGASRIPILNMATQKHKDLLKRVMDARKAKKPDIIAERELEGLHTKAIVMTSLLSIGGTLAYNGIVTGNGPTDIGERRALLATGWQPYSVRFQQDDGSYNYYSYNRLDPMGMYLGMIATFGEAAGHMGEKDLMEIGTHMGVSVIEAISSKTYMAGLVSVVNALSNPEQHGERWFQQLASSIVPAQISQANRMGYLNGYFFPGVKADPVMREVNGLLDAFVAKTPGISSDLPPKRNWFGEAIHWAPFLGQNNISPFQLPIATSTSPNNIVNREIARLVQDHNFAVSMNGFDSINGMELTPEERDQYIQLATGDPSRNGNDIRTSLTKLFTSSRYKNADDTIDGKQKLIKDLMRKRTARGRRVFLRKNTEFASRLRINNRQRSLAKRSLLAKRSSQQSGGSTLLASLTQTPDKLS